ncbi:MAG: flagellar biosynthesis protein FlhF [Planctomycetes bacterium]|nr:flagellar biosynthesis protein FlhF [Planctomycetota bacterium]
MTNQIRFEGRTMAEALAKVKRRLGPDAVILKTRVTNRGGLLGVGGKALAEIIAQAGHHPLPGATGGLSTSAPRPVPRIPARRDPPVAHPLPDQTRPATIPGRGRVGTSECAEGAANPVINSSNEPATSMATLAREVTALRELVRQTADEARRARMPLVPPALVGHYTDLIQAAVGDEIAQELVLRVRQTLSSQQLADPERVRQELAKIIADRLPVTGPITLVGVRTPKIVALVGPTGVGKTTTIAKLAAEFSIRQSRKVGVVTLDTVRIGAVDTLRTYTRIIKVPLCVAGSPIEFKQAVASMKDRDVIFVDTCGCGSQDRAALDELMRFFNSVEPDETHLVLSSTANVDVLEAALEGFKALGADRVIFTKLDEAIGLGAILRSLDRAEARLSYVTTGQRVPNDLEVGVGRSVARWIVGGTSARGWHAPAA